MTDDRDSAPNPGNRGARLAAKFALVPALGIILVLLLGAAGWSALRAIGQETRELLRAVESGNAATAMASGLLTRIDRTGWLVAAGVILGVLLLAGIYAYFLLIVVRPLRTNVRLMRRLAAGDGDEDLPPAVQLTSQLTRSDEIGDLSRAIHDLSARQREEADLANAVSAGDFSGVMSAATPSDALGQAIRRLAGVTIDTLQRTHSHAARMTAGCEAIASACGELSSGGDDMTGAASAISDGMARIGTHATENAGMAEEAGRLSGSGSQYIERGYEDVGEMGVVMLNMQACGDKIVQIAKSIGDIAFQTNLLAINASVEAARAGRHGKGFTIVADEVRRLASRTRKAAEETSGLMQETVEQVELAAAIAGRINATFADLQANIGEAQALMAKITAASGEQSSSVEQVSAALRRVEQSARKNMEHVAAVLDNANRLAGQTGRLHQTLGRFQLNFEPKKISQELLGLQPLGENENAL